MLFKLLTAAGLLLLPGTVTAQLSGKISDKPIGMAYGRGLNPERMRDYARTLTSRLDMPSRSLGEVPLEQTLQTSLPGAAPLIGTAMYLVPGLIPSLEPVEFQQVPDEAAAKDLLQRLVDQGGSGSELTGEDGRYKLVRRNSWTYQIAADQDVDTVGKSFSRRGYRMDVELAEKDGKRVLTRTQTWTKFYRLQDGFLFEADFQEIWDMALPTSAAVSGVASSGHDMGFEAFAERVPPGTKQLVWSLLNASVSTQLQQRDNEPVEFFDLRDSSGACLLAAARAMIFDLHSVSGWLRFADQQQDTIRGELLVETARNSALSKALDDLQSVRSRFAAILTDDAAVTAHLALQLPEDSAAVFDAAAAWLVYQFQDAGGTQTAVQEAAQHVADTLTAVGEHRQLEVCAKLGWSAESGGVIYGGVQVDDNPQLLPALHQLAVSAVASSDAAEWIQLVERFGHRYLQVTLPPAVRQQLVQQFNVDVSHLYLTHQNSCIWFAVGQQNAAEIIQLSVQQTSRPGRVLETSLLTLNVDAGKWLEYPQDDPTGLPALLLWLDETSTEFPPGLPVIHSHGGRPMALLQRVFELGGGKQIQLTVDADQQGLLARLNAGEAIANYYVARMVERQERQQARFRQE